MLVSMKDMLEDAWMHHCALPAFDISNCAMENPATWPFLVFSDARTMMKELARNKLRTFGSAGRLQQGSMNTKAACQKTENLLLQGRSAARLPCGSIHHVLNKYSITRCRVIDQNMGVRLMPTKQKRKLQFADSLSLCSLLTAEQDQMSSQYSNISRIL